MLYHSARGSVGYSIVGAPTIINNVVSDFSGRNYIQSASTFPGSTATSLEFATKFNISSFASASTIVSSTSSTIPFHLAIIDSKFKFYPGRENIYKVGNFVLSANTDYWIKLFWNSTNGWKLQYSTDGINYITDFENYNPSNSAPKDNYIVIGRNYPNGGQEGLLGTLNLNNTYITVNGQPWFGICPIEVKKHQIMGPVGYTVVGSPTITDGIASDFGQESYLISSSNLAKPLETECYARITVGQSTGNYNVFLGFTGGNYPVRYSPSYRFSFYKQNAGGWSDGVTRYAVGDLVDIRYIYKGGYLRLYTKLASAELWNEEMQLAVNSNPIYGVFYFGRNATANTQYIAGAIDLNHTYIKVNEKLWFWQPQETKRIVVNGVEVWTKPE